MCSSCFRLCSDNHFSRRIDFFLNHNCRLVVQSWDNWPPWVQWKPNKYCCIQWQPGSCQREGTFVEVHGGRWISLHLCWLFSQCRGEGLHVGLYGSTWSLGSSSENTIEGEGTWYLGLKWPQRLLTGGLGSVVSFPVDRLALALWHHCQRIWWDSKKMSMLIVGNDCSGLPFSPEMLSSAYDHCCSGSNLGWHFCTLLVP